MTMSTTSRDLKQTYLTEDSQKIEMYVHQSSFKFHAKSFQPKCISYIRLVLLSTSCHERLLTFHCSNLIGLPETQSTCNRNSNNNNNKKKPQKKKGNMIFIGGKYPGLILMLFPTYLIQLPVLSFYFLLSLTLTCCPEFPSSSCPSSYHHLSPEQLCLHPT